ncbi:MAG TPA: hypothetical protein PLL80_02385 [Candidatus Pacearchaeota archaeon]|nr:hypothetical protein [Candidatus Pacearchaeota archaeon]HOK94292.1 hypothetical protein [Candidatus Pacearchaeota archaeon]HPO75432.1 hypothetical protein [Candidatus Pacearchaeota archaeon]
MAISVNKKETAKIEFKPDKISLTLAGTILFLIFVFGGLKIYNSSLQSQIANTEKEIEKINTQRDPGLEKEMQSSIANFEKVEPLLNYHIQAKNIFTDVLEKDTYADVQISNFNFNAKDNTIALSVISSNAPALAMQVSIFKSDPKIKKVEVGGLSFSEKGIGFQIKITLDPNIIKY